MSINFNTDLSMEKRKIYNKEAGKPMGKRASYSDKTSAAINCDSIEISQPAAQSDKAFTEALSNRIVHEIKNKQVSDDCVEELKALVQSGQYHVNARRVAEKLLGYRE
ncbi:flagellar biosynthesis anti-sigma factor FlgM [Oribacterium sp. HCP28S3_H8]|uniref:flagellar biosynthesis anti-sigma factor FlgM n=1 Tax=Oribacterium sp. HCP28S3_H8 TaxID=3438945 RepID=UPI003F89513E